MPTNITEQIDLCKAALNELKELYDNKKRKTKYAREKIRNGLKITFPYHPYELNPCLTEDEVVIFEQKLGARFPEEFRLCLLHLGNGGGAFWDELDIEDIDEAMFYDGHIVLASSWPIDILLKLEEPHSNHIYRINTDNNEESKLFTTSFLDWFRRLLNEYRESLEKDEKQVHSGNNSELLSSIHFYEPGKQEEIISSVKELVAGPPLPSSQYISLLNSCSTQYLSSLQTMIGEKALLLHQENILQLSTSELIKILEQTAIGYLRLKDMKAQQLFEQSIALGGQTFHFVNLAELMLQSGQPAQAMTYLEKAPVTFYSTYMKAGACHALGDTSQALQLYQDSIRLYIGFGPAHEGLGDLHMSLKQFSSAVDSYRNAINKGHISNLQLLSKLAYAYALNNNSSDCAKIFKIIAELGWGDWISKVEKDPVFESVFKS